MKKILFLLQRRNKHMKLNLEINNTDKSPVKKVFIKKVVLKTLERSAYLELSGKILSLSIALVGEEEMCRLNQVYRQKNRPTDVLSFCEYEDAELLKNLPESELFLGELILCYNYIKYLSDDSDDKMLEKELAEIIAHGVLHLLGFQHGKKMFDIQRLVAVEIF
jgi:probable rRNA maturation factor